MVRHHGSERLHERSDRFARECWQAGGDTYQGTGANPGHSCIPEKGSSTVSVFRASNYPSGAVDPYNPDVVAVTFGSYINKDSNETNGCVRMGFASDTSPMYSGVKTPGVCANKILLSVSQNGGATFSGTGADPRTEDARHAVARAGAHRSVLAVGRVHELRQARSGLLRPPVRQRRDDRLLGHKPFRQQRSDELRAGPCHVELDAGADAIRGHIRRPVLRRPRRARGRREGVPDLVGHPCTGSVPVSRAAGHPAIRRSCAARRRRTAWWRTTRRRSWRPWACRLPTITGTGEGGRRRNARFRLSGGGGIRTRGPLARTLVFKTSAFDRSATPPGPSDGTAKPMDMGNCLLTLGISGVLRPGVRTARGSVEVSRIQPSEVSRSLAVPLSAFRDTALAPCAGGRGRGTGRWSAVAA